MKFIPFLLLVFSWCTSTAVQGAGLGDLLLINQALQQVVKPIIRPAPVKQSPYEFPVSSGATIQDDRQLPDTGTSNKPKMQPLSKNDENDSILNLDSQPLTSKMMEVKGVDETQLKASDSSVKLVIASGVGSSVEMASKNAAENALTQVVGTFIDFEKQINKRKEIRDGVQQITKNINTRMSEFSQGSISSFRTLDVINESDIFRVEAAVGVRLSEFKAYVKNLSSDQATIGANIFAQVAMAERNSQSAKDILLYKVLMPLLRAEVSEIKTGEPVLYQQLNEETRQRLRLSPYQLTSTTIVMPISISLQKNFLSNMNEIFEQINSKMEILPRPMEYGKPVTGICSPTIPQYAYQNNGLAMGLHSLYGPTKLYAFNNIVYQEGTNEILTPYFDNFDIHKRESWRIEHFGENFEYFVLKHRDKFPQLRVVLKDADNNILKEYIDPSEAEVFWVSDINPRVVGGTSRSKELSYLNIDNINSLDCFGLQRGSAIFPEKKIHLIMNLPASSLEKLKGVEVGFILP